VKEIEVFEIADETALPNPARLSWKSRFARNPRKVANHLFPRIDVQDPTITFSISDQLHTIRFFNISIRALLALGQLSAKTPCPG
jgi:hypothetical protein